MNTFSPNCGYRRPYNVGYSGSACVNSSTEKYMRIALMAAERVGAKALLLQGQELELPMYDYGRAKDCSATQRLVAELRRANGVTLASPGYHGSISGLMKNAINCIEELNKETAPYLYGHAVSYIATTRGFQGGSAALVALRNFVFALYGSMTPRGVVINTSVPLFGANGICNQEKVADQLECLSQQVAEFALHPSDAKPQYPFAAWRHTLFFAPVNPVPSDTIEAARIAQLSQMPCSTRRKLASGRANTSTRKRRRAHRQAEGSIVRVHSLKLH